MRTSLPLASVMAILLLAAGGFPLGSASAQSFRVEDWSDLQEPETVRQLMQGRKYEEALAAIDAAANSDKAQRDGLAYLRGRALELLGRYDEAIAAYQSIEREFPASAWARRAKFGQAIALMRKGDFRAAELIYREQAVRLLSSERKQEIADIYLEFALKHFQPADDTQQPDYQKALEFFQKALEVGPHPDMRPELEMLAARSQQHLGQHAEAAQAYRKFIEERPTHRLIIEARYRLAECHLAQGQPAEARRVWEDLLAAHPVDSAPQTLPELPGVKIKLPAVASPRERLIEATFNLPLTYGLPAPQSDEALNLGVAGLKTFIARFPDHRLASVAHLRIALSYAHRGRFEDAVAALKRYLDNPKYADREETPVARNLLGRSYLLQKKFDEALAAWRDYLAKHPAHESWSEVQRAIIDTEFLQGLEQRTAKRYEQARKLWNEFLVKYPLDERSRQILFEFGAMHHEQEDWDAALTDWRRLVTKYPGTEEASRAQLMIASTLEQKLGKFDEALKEYRKLDWGSMAAVAQRRIRQLTQKSLQVATERVFRSNETPRLKLATRNLDQVTVRAYSVDLETYFRKMHLARGVEGLDVSLIDPDQSFEFTIPDYVEHRQSESEVEVKLPAASDIDAAHAGVMVVTVSSATLEATTLVIQSDLDMVVKSSRDEVFVFAQNLRTGEPWASARLLVSNGSQVFAEASTGADGVFQHEYKELRDAGDIRVFAIAEGHVASNSVGLEGVAVAQGLADKGYIYTDRSAYRPRQMVHVRGVIRRVSADAYRVDAGKKYTLDVFDPRNRLIRQEPVTLSQFGTFHANFMLPPGSVQGDYRLVLRDEEDASFQGAFAVHEYQLQPVRLAVEVDRKVYYRGEEIEGKITARYDYGAPLSDREVHYQLAGGRSYTARTDERGEIKFKLPTREFSEEQSLAFVATLPERNVRTIEQFFLATHGFSISLDTVRPVYLAGETFEVTLRTSDAEGKPIGEKLTLHVLEQTTVDRRVGEKQVQQHTVTTDKDGVGRVTLRLEAGGRYILRAEGIDRFEHPVTGQHLVQVSDESDDIRLRLLADRHTFKVGDTADVKIHWREPPALALVTYQGARVLGYRLVRLQTGSNTLELPMAVNLAPNFDLAVTVMTDARAAVADANSKDNKAKRAVRRLHEASSPFTVQRELHVRLDTKRKAGEGPVRPGDEVEVSITATDPQGKPVSAELSLAMIEQSLLRLFPRQAQPIHDFFRGEPRQSAMRTTSSVIFDYRPHTRPINPRLLAEAERIEVEAAEAASVEELRSDVAMAVTPRIMVQEDEVAGLLDRMASEGWSDVGGAGSIQPFPTNLSLVVKQSQSVAGDMAAASGPIALGMGGQAAEGQVAQGFDLRAPNSAAYFESSGRIAGVEGWESAGEKAKLGKSLADSYSRDFDAGVAVPANERNLNRYFFKRQRRELVIVADGVQANFGGIALGDMDEKQLALLGEKLSDQAAVILPNMGQQETGYWNPAVVTDAQGKATITLTVPERTTAWELLAVGVTADTLAGEATSELNAQKDLFGELKLPLAFTDGDDAEVQVTVHNDAIENGSIEVTLKTTLGDKSVEEKQTIPVTSKGIRETSFKLSIRRPAAGGSADATARFELTVTAGEARDSVLQSVPVRPAGAPVYAIASGAAESDITAWVELPAGIASTSPSLEIIIGPTVERSLTDVLLGSAPRCQLEMLSFASGLDVAVSDVLAAVALQKLFSQSRDADKPLAETIDGRIRAAVASLIASQNDDGGWTWTAKAGKSDRYATARAVWALSLARQSGYPVADDDFAKAIAYLNTEVAATRDTDYESKAILLHALAVAGKGDFALANRLHRNRPALSNSGLAHLALAMAAMDRKPMAQELFDILATRNLDEPVAPRRAAAISALPWGNSPVEVRALYALALQQVDATSPKAKELVDWLLEHRTGHRWSPEKATGPAVLALAQWFGRTRFAGERYQLAVFVNNREVQVLDIDPAAGTQTVAVPANLLQAGKQRVNFVLKGRGRFTYQCVLADFVAADKLQSTTKDWRVSRRYEPAPLEYDGQEVPRGFGVVAGSYTAFRNPLTQLPVGKRGHVELIIYRDNLPQGLEDHQLEYLVITEPLPSGVTVIEQSVRGGFERFEIGPGAITFYVGNRRYVEPIQFEVHGYLSGSYQAAPTMARNAYRLDQMAIAPAKQLSVLTLGTASGDEYRLTPQELFELGKRMFAKQDWNGARTHLTDLFQHWNLQAEVYRETAGMLLDVHLETGGPAEVVRYFEIIKEKWPDLEVPFEKIMRVAAAYHEIGEYERSFLVFRATVESSFSRESGAAGFLEAQGEFRRSVEVMRRLLAEYPPEPYVAAAHYALAQQVYAKAPEAAADARLKEQKLNRVDLIHGAREMLEDFLTLHPDDPAADQASFSVANALLDLKQFKEAIARSNLYADRYPESDYLDSFWYVIGYSHFALGEHQAALEMCRRVAEARRTDKRTGREQESPNKWQAIYILGQVYHSLGQAAEAIREYTRVEEMFADAKQAIAYFTRQEIKLPEVTTVRPGEAAKVELSFRNVPACDVKVYRIDLMKFSLLNRDLGGITRINLAGIRPHHEANIELGDGRDYRDRTKEIPLPLADEGAYLVVCRGADLHASGLVLVTPLAVEVQEAPESGRVRTTVKDVGDDKYLPEVHVKVIGTRNADFVAGETDLRGVFVADAIRGTSTVIAQADGDRYAFFRGETPLGPPEAPAAGKPAAEPAADKPADSEGDLLDNLRRGNRDIQQQQQERLQRMYKQENKGVKVQEAF